MDTLLMTTVGSLLTIIIAAACAGGWLAWHAGAMMAERRHRAELATLRRQLHPPDGRGDGDTFVDLADEFGLVDRPEEAR